MIDERDRDRFYRNILSETLPRLVPVSRHKAGIVGEKFLDLIIEYGMPLKQAEPEAGDDIIGWACLTEGFMEEYRIPMEKRIWKEPHGQKPGSLLPSGIEAVGYGSSARGIGRTG